MDLFEFFTTVFSNLLGASIGAFLGYWFGVKSERASREERDLDVRLHFLNSVVEEIEYNYNRYKRATANKWDYTQSINIFYKTYTFESGVHSGKFDMLSHDLQVALTAFYLLCNKANSLLLEHESTDNPARLAKIERQRVSLAENLEKIMPEVTKYIDAEKDEIKRLQAVSNNHLSFPRPNIG